MKWFRKIPIDIKTTPLKPKSIKLISKVIKKEKIFFVKINTAFPAFENYTIFQPAGHLVGGVPFLTATLNLNTENRKDRKAGRCHFQGHGFKNPIMFLIGSDVTRSD